VLLRDVTSYAMFTQCNCDILFSVLLIHHNVIKVEATLYIQEGLEKT